MCIRDRYGDDGVHSEVCSKWEGGTVNAASQNRCSDGARKGSVRCLAARQLNSHKYCFPLALGPSSATFWDSPSGSIVFGTSNVHSAIVCAYRDQPRYPGVAPAQRRLRPCLLYTSDAADERSSVDLGGRR